MTSLTTSYNEKLANLTYSLDCTAKLKECRRKSLKRLTWYAGLSKTDIRPAVPNPLTTSYGVLVIGPRPWSNNETHHERNNIAKQKIRKYFKCR